MIRLKFCLLFSFFLIFHLGFSQKINRFRNKERQGKWIIYHDSAETKISSIGRYRKGDPKGVWKYYDGNGRLTKKEKFRFKKIQTSVYHPNGRVYRQGKARIVKENGLLHFYYYGQWNTYDTLGNPISQQTYKEGEKVSEEKIGGKTELPTGFKDSLVRSIRAIDESLRLYFDTVAIAEKKYGKASAEYQQAVLKNSMHTSKLLSELDQIILKYGYPGKTLVGDDYNIAFSIISAANPEYRAKYFKIITEAADKGELDWADVAYYVDKVKVSKKEKQVYCTQFIIDEQKGKAYFYPVEDLPHLNDRRNKAGIGEIDLSEIEFKDF
ncbi:MAG: toxin-antitoxin system YwqK family antitoxin [Cytophagaceae bacterium]